MVILEEETYKKFGYYSADWRSQSKKRIVVTCDSCGRIRVICKGSYRALCRSCAIKGENHPSFGRHRTKKQRSRLSESHKGKHPTEETRRKMSKAGKGKTISQETRRKLSKAFTGENHPNWRGGISFEPYCEKFNGKFKEYIRDKFNRTCYLCGKTEVENGKRLSVHHCNYDKNCGCAETEEDRKADNKTCQFVPLCISCHSKVHNDRETWERYFKNKLRSKLNGWYI